MNIHDLIRDLREPAKSKIVLLVADGLGGLPLANRAARPNWKPPRTPNLDACARDGVTAV